MSRKKKNAAPATPRACRGCGCTNERACEGRCFWVERDLCSRCVFTFVCLTRAELLALSIAVFNENHLTETGEAMQRRLMRRLNEAEQAGAVCFSGEPPKVKGR